MHHDLSPVNFFVVQSIFCRIVLVVYLRVYSSVISQTCCITQSPCYWNTLLYSMLNMSCTTVLDKGAYNTRNEGLGWCGEKVISLPYLTDN